MRIDPSQILNCCVNIMEATHPSHTGVTCDVTAPIHTYLNTGTATLSGQKNILVLLFLLLLFFIIRGEFVLQNIGIIYIKIIPQLTNLHLLWSITLYGTLC